MVILPNSDCPHKRYGHARVDYFCGTAKLTENIVYPALAKSQGLLYFLWISLCHRKIQQVRVFTLTFMPFYYLSFSVFPLLPFALCMHYGFIHGLVTLENLGLFIVYRWLFEIVINDGCRKTSIHCVNDKPRDRELKMVLYNSFTHWPVTTQGISCLGTNSVRNKNQYDTTSTVWKSKIYDYEKSGSDLYQVLQ